MSLYWTPANACASSLPKINPLGCYLSALRACCVAVPCQLSQDRRLDGEKRSTNQGNAPIALSEMPPRLGRVALDVALYGRGICIHDFHSLRQFLEVLEARRPRGIAAERFADG